MLPTEDRADFVTLPLITRRVPIEPIQLEVLLDCPT